MTQLPHTYIPFPRTPVEGQGESNNLRLETRIDRGGVLTYHSLTHDTTGGVLEKVYDSNNRLAKVVKRWGSSKSETHFDPVSGQRTRVTELSTMPDGNMISSEVIFYEDKRSSQMVTVFRASGMLVRIIERESRGSMMTFQGQTDYDVNGSPARTINQHTDADTGLLMHREQIHWMGEGQRAMTEHFFFDISGYTARYSKTIHHAAGGVFSEEIQLFDETSHKMIRRELAAFDESGRQTCFDVLDYDPSGQIGGRSSTFFDPSGNPIITRRSSPGQNMNASQLD